MMQGSGRLKLFALFIFALVLASAVPVKAETQYYALRFDGEDDYVRADNVLKGDNTATIIIPAYIERYNSDRLFATSDGNLEVYLSSSKGFGILLKDNGSNNHLFYTGQKWYGWHQFRIVVGTSRVLLFVDGKQVLEEDITFTKATWSGDYIYVGQSGSGTFMFKGKVAAVLVYDNVVAGATGEGLWDVLNPHTTGYLKIWLAPDSVDTASGEWLDKSGNGNDGTIVGATAERVSIPHLYVYDANTSEQIPHSNMSLTMLYNNTTTSLIPSLPVLPWNKTVTLNISAVNYESRTISTWTGVDLISVYLAPTNTTTEENGTLLTQPTETPTTPTEPFFNYTNDYGFFGFRLGDKLMRFQIDEVIPEFFNLTPIFAIFIPLIMTLGIGVATWYYSRNSLVVLGVLAIMNTFFFLLGLKVELSMIGPLTALVIFFVAWIFWDLYKSKERV